MKAIRLIMVLVLSIGILIPLAHAEAPTSPHTPPTGVLTTKIDIEAYVRKEALKSGLIGLYETLRYESAGWQNIQSMVKDPTGPNGKEDSWGICQLHAPSNPTITMAQAMDVEFCVQYTISEFEAGRANRWTGYRLFMSGIIQ